MRSVTARRLRSATKSAMAWLKAVAASTSSRAPVATTGVGSPWITRCACSASARTGRAKPRDKSTVISSADASVALPMSSTVRSSCSTVESSARRERLAVMDSPVCSGSDSVRCKRSTDGCGGARLSSTAELRPMRSSSASKLRAA